MCLSYLRLDCTVISRYLAERWSNDELLGTSVIDTTIPSVSDMLNIINLPSLAERRLRTRLVMMYKVSFHLVAVPSDILIVSDTRTRK
jgi:hypothetical protein